MNTTLALGASSPTPSARITQCSHASLQSANIHTQSSPLNLNQCSSERSFPFPPLFPPSLITFLNANLLVSPTLTMTLSLAQSLPRSGSRWYLHATSGVGYRFNSAQSNLSPVRSRIHARRSSTSGVKGTGDITFPEYAKPATPGSAIQHVSRRSSTTVPSRVVRRSRRNGTSAARASVVRSAEARREYRAEALEEAEAPEEEEEEEEEKKRASSSSSSFAAAAAAKMADASSHPSLDPAALLLLEEKKPEPEPEPSEEEEEEES